MYQFSQHFIKQMQIRNISMDEASDVLSHPQYITKEDGLTVYQKLINKNNKHYLLRIFKRTTCSSNRLPSI